MFHRKLGKRAISSILAMSFIVSGCMPSDIPTTRSGFNTTDGDTVAGATSGAGDGTEVPSSIGPTVEIRHLIEPNLSTDPNYSSGTGYAGGGSYVRKLTLPKNFAGKLYLAGINISTLANRHVKVRFKFGMGHEPITIPGVVATAPGITPQTNIHVLVMDLRSEPFRSLRLPYDLYDYNDYDTGKTPVQDNRDSGLYCRGLKLEDDPTFTGVGQCDGVGEECNYAYAKVIDQGLIKKIVNGTTETFVPSSPSLPQARSVTGSAYYQDFMAKHLMKPLIDNAKGPFKFSEPSVPSTLTDATSVNFALTASPLSINWAAIPINGVEYRYRGPYRLVNAVEWQAKFLNLVGPKRLFRETPLPYTGPMDGTAPENNFCLSGSTSVPCVYFGSYMFPLATQIDLPANVPHLSSNTWNGVRTENTLSSSGKTLWMDGSNARAQSKNTNLEHVGSCNVSATIEIIAKDDNLNDYVVALSDDVKLQLVRPIQYYTDTGNDVLYSNFKTCSSNASCGGNECCFNNRCWDQSLVSQCYDSNSPNGNNPIGATCSTDLECSSLCCNRTNGLCAPHNTLLSSPVLCSKPIGDFCIAKDWCQKSPVVTCLVVKTGTNAVGDVTCAQRCYTTEEFGDCKAGVCTAPFQPPIPVFDPDAPGACADAVPPPSF